jgi:hypothetical protein
MFLGSNKSTHTAVQSFVEYIQEALDKQLYVIGNCLDLTKAYDVKHSILLDKLELYGIRGPGKAWFIKPIAVCENNAYRLPTFHSKFVFMRVKTSLWNPARIDLGIGIIFYVYK